MRVRSQVSGEEEKKWLEVGILQLQDTFMGRDYTREQEREQEEGGTTVLQYCDAKELIDGLIDFCTRCEFPAVTCCVTLVTTLSTCIMVDFFFSISLLSH